MEADTDDDEEEEEEDDISDTVGVGVSRWQYVFNRGIIIGCICGGFGARNIYSASAASLVHICCSIWCIRIRNECVFDP